LSVGDVSLPVTYNDDEENELICVSDLSFIAGRLTW
jgi:hypothetical protein